jgi:hypothetical protein
MIFDVSMGSVLYALPALDLTDQILLELNKDTIKPTEGTTPEPPKPEGEIPPEIKPPEGFGDEFKPDKL